MLQLFESDQNLLKLPMSGSFTYVLLIMTKYLQTRDGWKSKDQDTEDTALLLPPLPIATRNSRTYLTKIADSDANWHEKYERIKKALNEGYFTSCIESFRPVGGPVAEIQEMVAAAMHESLSPQIQEELIRLVFLNYISSESSSNFIRS